MLTERARGGGRLLCLGGGFYCVMNKCAVRAARVRARRRATMCCKRGQPERPGGVAYSRVLDVGRRGAVHL